MHTYVLIYILHIYTHTHKKKNQIKTSVVLASGQTQRSMELSRLSRNRYICHRLIFNNGAKPIQWRKQTAHGQLGTHMSQWPWTFTSHAPQKGIQNISDLNCISKNHKILRIDSARSKFMNIKVLCVQEHSQLSIKRSGCRSVGRVLAWHARDLGSILSTA